MRRQFSVIVVGGGHAGVEAAWAAANLLAHEPSTSARSVALVTLDPSKIGVMSCNPAIGGLAKGQLVREIDALGGVMGLAADASGIQFKMLNASKGPAVWGPRCQSDKHAYADTVRALIASRPEIEVIAGAVERLLVRDGAIEGVEVRAHDASTTLLAPAVVLTTGTFMRGLMHTGETRTPGGRVGEAPASAISRALTDLGFELGRLKTGTPPRLRRSTIEWDSLDADPGDSEPTPFSELTPSGCRSREASSLFPALPQVECRRTRTTPEAHAAIRDNLHRAPMYSGAIESVGPRYCPSIEDKVVRFAERESHGVYLEPESLRDDIIYCNGISSSLPADVQDVIVRTMPGCQRAEIVRYGYAVEYDMVRPHQILATGMTKRVRGLFLAGQINGTSGYEEAAAQGLVAGVNAVRHLYGDEAWIVGREEAYIGVLMDDLVTKTPVEPYRMFTSRAEHRLLLRADNAPDRLTPIADRLGLLGATERGRARAAQHRVRTSERVVLSAAIDSARTPDGAPLPRAILRADFTAADLRAALAARDELAHISGRVWLTAYADRAYEPYLERQRAEVRRHAEMERRAIPAWLDYSGVTGLRAEARDALARFTPSTFGQAARLEGVTPADVTLLAVHAKRGPGPAAREAITA